MLKFQMPRMVNITKRQREELAEHMENETRCRVSEIRDSIPKRPSLDKHIIAAIYSDTLVMKDHSEILPNLKKRVQELRRGDELIKYGYRSEEAVIEFNVNDIFEVPELYKTEMEEYLRIKEGAEMQIKLMQDNLKILKLKILAGSKESLQTIFGQIDEIGGELSLETMIQNNLLPSPSNSNLILNNG